MGLPKATIGYKYYMSMHMGIGRGANEIVEIRVGDVTLLDTPVCIAEEGQLVRLNKPELFGGETKEGGIDGAIYFYTGIESQVLLGSQTIDGVTLPGIAGQLGGDVPNFRGVLTAWFDGMVCALNPYPKEWSFRVRRTSADWYEGVAWYEHKATISLTSNGKPIKAMNGSHILYEINTNPEWGRGMPAELLDENSYIKAANQLCDEGLGLCLPWFRQESIKEFIPVVIDHIAGVQYVDRTTGKMTLKLIRNDYVLADLPIFTLESGLLRLEDDDASGEETAYNEIIVKGFDPTTKEDISVRWQNGASIRSLGEIISNTIEYRGIPTRDLLARIAEREAMTQLPLRRMTAFFDRRGYKLAPGMPFRIQCPSKGIADMVVRAGEITDDSLRSGEISMKIVEDVFAMPTNTYIEPTLPVWTPPSFTAVPAPESRLIEANWRDYYLRSAPADRDAVDAGTSYVAMVAKKPAGVQTQGYDIATTTNPPDDYATYTNDGFTAWLTLEGALTHLATTLTVEAANRDAFVAEFTPGMAVQVDDEQMEFVDFDVVTGIANLKRGVADTLPQVHADGSTIWLVDDEMVSDGKEYVDGEEVFGKALTRTSTDLLLLDDAPESSVEVNQRVFRPYPPGDVKVDGDSVYSFSGLHAEPEITWTHRDRLVQADVLVGHGEASIGPEAGVTYNIRVYDTDGVSLLRDTDVGLVDTWTYDLTMQAADGSPTAVFIELESVRDDLASHFLYRFRVVVSGGWGYDWGFNWGGGS